MTTFAIDGDLTADNISEGGSPLTTKYIQQALQTNNLSATLSQNLWAHNNFPSGTTNFSPSILFSGYPAPPGTVQSENPGGAFPANYITVHGEAQSNLRMLQFWFLCTSGHRVSVIFESNSSIKLRVNTDNQGWGSGVCILRQGEDWQPYISSDTYIYGTGGTNVTAQILIYDLNSEVV